MLLIALVLLMVGAYWTWVEYNKDPWDIPYEREIKETDDSEFYCARYKYGEIPGPCVSGQCSKCDLIEGYLEERNGEID